VDAGGEVGGCEIIDSCLLSYAMIRSVASVVNHKLLGKLNWKIYFYSYITAVLASFFSRLSLNRRVAKAGMESKTHGSTVCSVAEPSAHVYLDHLANQAH
jgi:hypothetical protein